MIVHGYHSPFTRVTRTPPPSPCRVTYPNGPTLETIVRDMKRASRREPCPTPKIESVSLYKCVVRGRGYWVAVNGEPAAWFKLRRDAEATYEAVWQAGLPS
jgi:hypothetical protein